MSAPLSVETRTEALRRVLTTTAAHGWEFSLWEGAPDDEPRIRDVDAAERLGYGRPRDVRKIIERIWPGFAGLYVREAVETVPMPRGGSRKVTVREAWLTEAQLLKVIARSETPVAETILDDMIAVYMAVRRHLAATVPVKGHARKLPGTKALPAPAQYVPLTTRIATPSRTPGGERWELTVQLRETTARMLVGMAQRNGWTAEQCAETALMGWTCTAASLGFSSVTDR